MRPPAAAAALVLSSVPRLHAHQERKPVVVAHYHKTGFELSRCMMRPFAKALGSEAEENKMARRNGDDMDSATHDKSLRRLRRPGIPIRIQEAPDVDLGKLARRRGLLHFVRDPISMVLSGYRYHGPGNQEEWAQKPRTAFCRRTKSQWEGQVDATMVAYTTSIAMTGLGLSERDVDEIWRLCDSLWRRGSRGEKASYSAVLRALGPDDGVRLEAIRALVNNRRDAGGDVTRMAHRSGEESCHNDTLRINLADVSGTADGPVFQCIFRWVADRLIRLHWGDVRGRVARLLEETEQCNQEARRENAAHFTGGLMSSGEERRLRALLAEDPLLGSPLRRATEALQRCPCTCSCSAASVRGAEAPPAPGAAAPWPAVGGGGGATLALWMEREGLAEFVPKLAALGYTLWKDLLLASPEDLIGDAGMEPAHAYRVLEARKSHQS